MKQYPEKTEVIYTLKRVSAYFLGAIFLNALGTVVVFGVSGKWNWFPAFLFGCASLITTIIAFVITFFETRAWKIYRIFIICHFTSGLLPLGYALVAVLLTMHRVWGSVVIVLLIGLLLFRIPIMMNEHAKNFTYAFSKNRAAGVYNPKTNIWKVSVPIIRISQEQDRKINQISKALVPFMYPLAVSVNRLLGKYSLILILVLLPLSFFYIMKEWLFFLNIYKEIKNLERQIGEFILLPTKIDHAPSLTNSTEN